MEINTGKKDFSNRKCVIFIETQDNPFYYQYLYAISRKVKVDSGELKVIILEERLNRQNFLKVVRFLKRKRCQSIVVSNLQKIIGVDVDVWQTKRFSLARKKLVSEKINQCLTAIDLLSIFPEFKYLGSALHSFFCSSLSMSSDPFYKIRKYRNELREATMKFLGYLDIAQEILKHESFDLIMFTNGRTPEQAVFKECAESESIPWLCLEHGARPGETYFLENFQTQDRVRTQALIQYTFDNLNMTQVKEFVDEFEYWKFKQENDSNHNPTLAFRSDWDSHALSPRLIPIFTSSIDEEMSCPGWSFDNVRNLTEKTIKFCDDALNMGWDPVVVIHPNTLNKRWHDLSFLLTELKKNDVRVSLPWDSTSSYKYLDESKLIVTWRSTIGLEAVIKGKCVLTLSDTTYDILLKLRNSDQLIWTEESISCDYSEGDISLAKFVIYFYTHFGYNLFEGLTEKDLQIVRHYEKILSLGSFYKSLRNKTRKYLLPLFIFSATPKEFIAFLRMFLPKDAITPIMYGLTRIYWSRR